MNGGQHILTTKKIKVDVGGKVVERVPINRICGNVYQVLVKYNKAEYPIQVIEMDINGKPLLYGLIRTRG